MFLFLVCKILFIFTYTLFIFVLIFFQDAFVKISRNEGIQSLWSGLPPTLVVAIPNTVIYFTTYEQLRTASLRYLPGNGIDPPSWVGGVAGGLARIWAVSVVSPFELVRTKMQAKSMPYKG